MARIRTINDYQSNNVTVSDGLRSRYCPGMRSCWSFSFVSFSPFGRSTNADCLRRVCMILTLACYTIVDVVSLYYNFVSMNVLGLVIGVILSLIGFFFIGFCLAKIGDAEGERMVMSKNVGRWHFDAFLLFAALAHISLLVGRVSRLWSGFLGLGFSTAWIIMWILIVAVAWITSWDPSYVSLA